MTAAALLDVEDQIARNDDTLAALNTFRVKWGDFEKVLREIADACAGTESIYGKPEVKPLITEADKIREELRPMRSRALGSFSSRVLAILLDTSLRADDSGRLRDVFAEPQTVGTELGYDQETIYTVSPERLDVNLGECTSVINEKWHELDAAQTRLIARRDLLRLQVRDEQEQKLSRQAPRPSQPPTAVTPEVTLKALLQKWISRLPFPRFWKFVGAAVVDHLKVWIGAVLVALVLALLYFLFPGSVRKVMRSWSHLQIDTTSHAASPPPASRP